MKPPSSGQPAVILLLLAAGLLLPACASPLQTGDGAELRSSILTAQQRELAIVQERGNARQKASASSEPSGLPPSVLGTLDTTSGPASYTSTPVRVGPSLFGEATPTADISLSRSLITTVSNNLTIQFGRLAPAISEARLTATEAAFDWTLFATTSYAYIDQPRTRTSVFNPGVDQRQDGTLSAGIRRRLVSGGGLTLQQELQRSDDDTPNQTTIPNPSNSLRFTAQLDQPLLRNFGSDAALAEVRLAANAERDAIQQLKATLVQQVAEAEAAYWQLVRAHGELKIAQRLLDRGVEVRDTLRKRQGSAQDVRASQFSDAVATVESRRADVIRAEATLRQSSDRVKQLMNDPQAGLATEILLVPTDAPLTAPLTFTLADVLTTALANRAEVQRALLAINDSAIRQQLADNARLPQLDMRLQVQVSELRDNLDTAYGRLIDANFVNYLVGLNYEQPIGNRGPEAAFRGRMLENLQAQLTYREVVQRIILDVKTALRSVTTSFALIEQTRASRIAAAENLRTLEVEEKTIQALSPEFLDLKLRRQQALAGAELAELAALTEYNASLARLHAAMGTALQRNGIRFEVESQ
jgi:outer membrane protein TolC